MDAPSPRKKARWEPSRISALAAPITLLEAGSTASRSRNVSSGYVACRHTPFGYLNAQGRKEIDERINSRLTVRSVFCRGKRWPSCPHLTCSEQAGQDACGKAGSTTGGILLTEIRPGQVLPHHSSVDRVQERQGTLSSLQ